MHKQSMTPIHYHFHAASLSTHLYGIPLVELQRTAPWLFGQGTGAHNSIGQTAASDGILAGQLQPQSGRRVCARGCVCIHVTNVRRGDLTHLVGQDTSQHVIHLHSRRLGIDVNARSIRPCNTWVGG